MRVIAGALLALIAFMGICAGAVALGFITIPLLSPETQEQSNPPLQPIPTQLSTISDTAQSTTDPDADLTLTVSERYLNRQLSQGLPQDGAVQDTRLDLHANNLADVLATVEVNSSLTVRPKLSLALSIQNGRMVINVQQIDVGGFDVPQSWIEPQIAALKQTTEREFNRQFTDLEKSSGLKLLSLSTSENTLTLHFVQ